MNRHLLCCVLGIVLLGSSCFEREKIGTDPEENVNETYTEEMAKIAMSVNAASNQVVVPQVSGTAQGKQQDRMQVYEQWTEKSVSFENNGTTVTATVEYLLTDADGNQIDRTNVPSTFIILEKSSITAGEYAAQLQGIMTGTYSKTISGLQSNVNFSASGNSSGSVTWEDGLEVTIDSASYLFSMAVVPLQSQASFSIKIYFSAQNGDFHGDVSGSVTVDNITTSFDPQEDIAYSLTGAVYYKDRQIGTITIDENGNVSMVDKNGDPLVVPVW